MLTEEEEKMAAECLGILMEREPVMDRVFENVLGFKRNCKPLIAWECRKEKRVKGKVIEHAKGRGNSAQLEGCLKILINSNRKWAKSTLELIKVAGLKHLCQNNLEIMKLKNPLKLNRNAKLVNALTQWEITILCSFLWITPSLGKICKTLFLERNAFGLTEVMCVVLIIAVLNSGHIVRCGGESSGR